MKNGLIYHVHRILSKGRCFFLLTLFLLCAMVGLSQDGIKNIKYNISFSDNALVECIDALQKQTGVRIFYEASEVNKVKKRYTKSFNQASLQVIIDYLLDHTLLEYDIIDDKKIVIRKQAQNTAVASGEPLTLKGRVVDFETSAPLPGASVKLAGTSRAVASDNKGYYSINGVKSGDYTLEVTYIGYAAFMEPVALRNNLTLDVRLQAGGGSLGEIVVSAAGRKVHHVTHTTDRTVLESIKSAQSVVSGISSQQIAMSADRNVAEVVKKIAGVTIKDDKFVIIRGMNERYNLTYLNGNVAPGTELYSRAFSLDLLPSRIIDRILVYKSPAPDLMGDMTGGAVKIFTKDAKAVKHFDVELQMGYRSGSTFNSKFMTYQGSSTDFLGFDNGVRKLPAVVPGYGDFSRAGISQKDYAQHFSPYLQYGYKTALPMLQLTANYYNTFNIGGKRVGMLSSLSYKTESQQLNIDRAGSFWGSDGNGRRTHEVTRESQSMETVQLNLLQNFTYKLRDSSRLFFKNYVLQQGQQTTVVRTSRNNQYVAGDSTTDLSHLTGINWKELVYGYNIYERNIILGYTQRFLYAGNLGGEHYFSKGKQQLEWNLGYTFSRQQIPDQRVIRFNQNRQDGGGVRGLGETADLGWVASYRYIKGPDDIENRNNNLERGMISRTWSRNNEHVYNGAVDYTNKLAPWITFKAGTYQQWKARVLFRRAYTVNEGDLNSAGYPESDHANIGSNGRYMDFNKVFFTEQDLGKVWSNDYLKDDGSALTVFDRTSGSDAYTATEQLNAGYAALSLLPFNGKLDIYGGLRVEYDRQKVAGAIPGSNPGSINHPVLVDNKTTDYLPSVNISYRPSPQLVARAAYGKTVNRPEFRELSPYRELDQLNNQTVGGNHLLKAATATNYDMRIEWYPKNNDKAETFSVGAFYKALTNPIERMVTRDLLFGGPASISFGNADKATIKGLEIDLRKNLGFIPLSFFRNLSFIGNLSIIKSEVNKQLDTLVLKNPDPAVNPHYTRQLQGQAPYAVNLGLYYDNAGTGTKLALSWNKVGPRIYAAANGAPFSVKYQGAVPVVVPGNQGSLIELERQMLDLALTQRIIKSLLVKLSAQNILNQPIRMAEDENFTYKYEKAFIKRTGDTYQSDTNGDMISSEYKLGTHFILSMTYSF
ncbi:TonB-dependent receptor [Chitinophaga qingshengii]|uniref:TonB-dependent receptor n=1 Tax=Chitinophaga qingshengii TaxID=1569794 RepID=A0ABR7TVE1_9BACT|nr:TonB-dependent receptor [Chitinophaga qingshengii]MBC9934456.1 TonB-dependent receptor [Chitinophaga qingshengii]